MGDQVSAVDANGDIVESAKIAKIVKRFGMQELDLKTAYAGDIVSIAGLTNGTVGHTINTQGKTNVIPSIPIDPPMLSFDVTYNDSPLKGTEGDKVTYSQIRDRLNVEAADDVSLRISSPPGGNMIEMAGRGDLHLGVIIEKMRREGFEMAVSPPKVLTITDENGETKEPFEEVTIELKLEYVSAVVEKLNQRKGILIDAVDSEEEGLQILRFKVPTRGLLGFRSYLTTETRGSAQF